MNNKQSFQLFNVAKYNLGKVRLEPMELVVSTLTVHDLQGGPQEICRAVVLHCTTCAGYELAIIISYPTSANGEIVLLKTPPKYKKKKLK